MAEPIVHRLTEADIDAAAAGPALAVEPTQAVVAKAVVSLIFAAMAYYYLHTGRSHRDPRRLVWAAVYGVLTVLVFALS